MLCETLRRHGFAALAVACAGLNLYSIFGHLQGPEGGDVNYPSIAYDALDFIRAPYPANQSVRYPSRFGEDRVKVQRDANGTRCFIVGRETDERGDWFANLRAGNSDIRDATGARIGEGFSGFVQAYDGMRLAVNGLMDDLCDGVETYVYTGYSRGASIATVFAFAHVRARTVPAILVTFGSPRVLPRTESNAAQSGLAESHRVVLGTDPVPSVPPASLGIVSSGGAYIHVGARVYGSVRGRNAPGVRDLREWRDHLEYLHLHR